MSTLHISLGFAELGNQPLDDFASNIILKMTGNAAYPTPPVTMVDLTTAQGNFHASVSSSNSGGPMETAERNALRAVLIGDLRQLANYVEGKCGGNEAVALSSGFEVVMSHSSPQQPLATPVILSITNQVTTQLAIKIRAVDHARAYEFQVTVGAGAPVHAGTFPSTRNIALLNLIPGTIYAVQVRAVGGSTGFSNWSDPVSHMAT